MFVHSDNRAYLTPFFVSNSFNEVRGEKQEVISYRNTQITRLGTKVVKVSLKCQRIRHCWNDRADVISKDVFTATNDSLVTNDSIMQCTVHLVRSFVFARVKEKRCL